MCIRDSVSAVEIAGGLKAGEKVVISGSEDFDNAPHVRIKE